MIYDGLNHARDLGAADANINYAIQKATQFANERDAAEAECKKLKSEIDKQNKKYLALGHKYNALVVQFNNMAAEKDEVIEELEADVDACKEIIGEKNTEIENLSREKEVVLHSLRRIGIVSTLDNTIRDNEEAARSVLNGICS